MKKFSILFIFIASISFSQKKYYLKDKKTNEPIAYANIWQSNKIISTSDSLGVFILDSINVMSNKYKITSIGYKTIENIKLTGINIYLETEFTVIDEIVISKNIRNKKHKIGKLRNGDVGICAEMNKDISQIAKYFKNETKSTMFHLEKIKFKSICSDKNRIISVSVFSLDKSGLPYEILNRKNIIYKFNKGHNTNEINLSNEKILFPEEGIFIVLNYLFLEENKVYNKNNLNWYHYEPSIDANYINGYSDSWYNLNGEWKKSNTYNISMELTVTN